MMERTGIADSADYVQAAAEIAGRTSRRRRWLRAWNKYKYLYLLLLPGILYFIVFHYLPLYGILITFKQYSIVKGITGSDWAGLKWFHLLFASADFWTALRNTIIISFYKLIFGFPVPVALAILLNEVMNRSFKRVVQTIVYFPHFISWVILGGIMFTLFSSDTGIFTLFGMKTSLLTHSQSFRSLLVISGIWKEAGWGTVIYLAAIAGINPEMYEAATIDGANRLQAIRFITIPSIRGTIVILLILHMGHILNAGFEQVFILYNPMVYQVADIIDTYVYRVGITTGQFSLAAAAGLFKSVVGLMMIISTNWLARRLGNQSLW